MALSHCDIRGNTYDRQFKVDKYKKEGIQTTTSICNCNIQRRTWDMSEGYTKQTYKKVVWVKGQTKISEIVVQCLLCKVIFPIC